MPTVSEMLSGSEPQSQPSGCKQCDDLRKVSGGKVIYCLEHDKTITAEERQRYGVAFRAIPEIRENLTKGVQHAKNQ